MMIYVSLTGFPLAIPILVAKAPETVPAELVEQGVPPVAIINADFSEILISPAAV